jgi:hypothetical protein
MAKKGGGGQKVTTQLDPKTQQYVQQMRGMAGTYAGDIAKGNYFAPTNATFQQGLGGLLDPAGAAQQFMNPFEQQVIGGVQSDFDRQRQGALMGAAQNATSQGAFGGSRSGVLQAQALGDVNRNEASTLAGLRMGGYNNAMNLGMGRSQALMGAGELERQVQNQQLQNGLFGRNQAMQMMNLGMGPYGTTQHMAPQGQNNWLSGAAGGAMAGSAFGPWGAAIGGGIGLLGSL